MFKLFSELYIHSVNLIQVFLICNSDIFKNISLKNMCINDIN